MFNRVILMGRLTKDPEFKETTSGVPVCRFSVAVNRQFANKQTGEREADFVDCDAWRNTAEFVSRYFSKGDMIHVEGELRNNNYEDGNGVKHYGMRVLVNSVSFCGSNNQNTQQDAPAASKPKPNPAAKPAQASAQLSGLGELDEFEEILSDGEIPF